MDDAKRFLRFVLPGLASTLQFFLFIWILRPHQVSQFFLKSFQNGGGLGPALTIIVASGGLGFVLSTLYHSIYWCRLLDRARSYTLTIDHRDALNEADLRGILRSFTQKGSFPLNNASRRDAWRIATAIWHARLGTSPRLKEANSRTDSLTSIVHSLGTLVLGTLAASVSALVVFLYIDPSAPLRTPINALHSAAWVILYANLRHVVLFAFVSIFLLIVEWHGFRVTIGHAQQVIDMILLNDLRDATTSELKGRAFEWSVRTLDEDSSRQQLSQTKDEPNSDRRVG